VPADQSRRARRVTTTGTPAAGFNRIGAVSGDVTYKTFGAGNGFESADAIGSKGYTYEMLFDKVRTLDKIYIYHCDTDEMPADKFALKDFTVEYLNPTTNEWEEMRSITDNTSNANYLGFALPTQAKGVRIKAAGSVENSDGTLTQNGTNAADGKFRLTDVQCFEPQGLASSMQASAELITDVVDGWFAQLQSSIESKTTALDTQITKEQDRIDKYQEKLIKQYAAMETAMSAMQSQASYITGLSSSSSSSSKLF
jgi:hypothetical protein